jgi:hypothetical protein
MLQLALDTSSNKVGGGIGFLILILAVLFFLDRRD